MRRSSPTRAAGLLIVALTLIMLYGAVQGAAPAMAQITPGGDGREEPIENEQPITEFDTVPPKPEEFDRVYDTPKILDSKEFDRFHYDIGRLWYHGLPAMIFIRESFQDQAESQIFADQMRATWNIESAPGADDGLVFVATIRPRFPHTAIITASYGENTFPTGQLTADGFLDVLNEEATPRMRVGNVNGGLTYALRRVIYDTEYGAPFPSPRTTTEEAAGWIFSAWNLVAAVVIAMLALVPSRVPVPSMLRRRWWQLGIAGAMTVIGLAGAVFARSDIATALGGCAALTLAWLAIQLGRRSRGDNDRRHIVRHSRRRRRPVRSVRHA